MKTKATPAPLGESKAKYAQGIQNYLERIEAARVELRRGKTEIERLKAMSKRRLAEIDAVLQAC